MRTSKHFTQAAQRGSKKRNYQVGFYNSSTKVRDPASRRWQAAKISYAISNYAGRDLSSLVCLDVGCSSGIITSLIAPLFCKTIGLDYDEVALKAIDVTAHAMVQFIRGDAMYLPFMDNSVDVIVCAQVYEHVPDDKLLLKEIYRVLKPGGIVFFSGPNWLFPVEPHYHLPFLHWLPRRFADSYLRVTGRGYQYYEQIRPLWALRKLVRHFLVQDITLEMLQRFYLYQMHWAVWLTRYLPRVIWKPLLFFLPSFNWILYKPAVYDTDNVKA